MKYAIIGPRKHILRILDKPPVGDQAHLELSDADALIAQEFIDQKQSPIILNGVVTTLREQQLAGTTYRWDEATKNFVEFVRPPVVPKALPAWRVKAVTKLTPYQGITLYNAITAVLNSLSDPMKTVASTSWYEGNVVERNSTTVLSLASALGLTSEQLDALFIQAASFDV